MLQVEGITVSISGVTILRSLSLAAATGATLGLVGRNGAGKTTTLRAIMGLAPLETGRMRLDETALDALAAYERARLGIGYLPEDRRLVGTLSVADNLRIPAQSAGFSNANERIAAILKLLPEVELLLGRKAMALSGGQQKLVALARAFVNGRKLLLLDEPFEGVSTALSRRLAQVIREFQTIERGVTVLIAESDLKRVALLTDRAFVIERGEVSGETNV